MVVTVAKYPYRHRVSIRRFAAVVLLCLVASSGAAAQQSAPSMEPAAQQAIRAGNEALLANRFQDAEKAFKKAAKIQHDACFVCSKGLALAQVNLSDSKAALKSAAAALALAADDRERADAHHLRGYILSAPAGDEKKAQEMIKEAETEFRKAVELGPTVPEYHLRLGAILMRESQDEEGKQEVSLYLQREPQGRFAEYARQLAANPRRARENYAPDFRFTTLQGETLSLSDLAGKYVVLDFWATWCPPCRASVGELRELTRKYPRDKVVLLSISADEDEKKWRDFVEKQKMDWPHYRDSDDRVQKTFNVRAFPTYILIDPEGIIRQRIVGENPQQSIVGRLKDSLARLSFSATK